MEHLLNIYSPEIAVSARSCRNACRCRRGAGRCLHGRYLPMIFWTAEVIPSRNSWTAAGILGYSPYKLSSSIVCLFLRATQLRCNHGYDRKEAGRSFLFYNFVERGMRAMNDVVTLHTRGTKRGSQRFRLKKKNENSDPLDNLNYRMVTKDSLTQLEINFAPLVKWGGGIAE